MEHPLFDPTNLTDDELIDKLQKSREHMGNQSQLGHDYTVESIEGIVRTLEAEQVRRFTVDQNESNADTIKEALKSIDFGKIEEIDPSTFDMDPNDIARSYKK